MALGQGALVVTIALLAQRALAEGCVQPPRGLVAWWPFDETVGPVAADRTGAHAGAWSGRPTPVQGRVRNALSLGGTSFVAVPDSDAWAFGTRDFTIELWASFDADGGNDIGHPGAIFIGNDEGPFQRNKWFFALGGGVLNFHVNGPAVTGSFFPRVPFAPTLGRWYHLAVTRQGTLYTIYVDGAAAGSASYSWPIPDVSAPLTIGQAEQLGYFRGRLDEVTIYDRALAADEVRAVAAAGEAGKCIGLAIHPSRGGDTGRLSVRIDGKSFVASTSVRLRRSGEDDVVATDVSVQAAGTRLAATFDLDGKARGAWDVVIQPPGAVPIVLSAAFVVEAGRAPQPWADIIGLGFIRVGRPQAFHVMYGNRSNVDLPVMLLRVGGIPADATVEAEFAFQAAPPLGATSTGGPPTQQAASGLVMPLRVYGVPAGFVGALPFRLTVRAPQSFDLSVEAVAELGR